ncbi:MAG: hypothetical protein J6574_08970 [Gilliamella sp.]|uniref:hypothetical protein n=1 Tax=Snodgrassella communis TaxID=2946699 RepID=UPI001EF427AE|nr:hypothetical protein [Snodgrassella communis]MCO6561210.1 hypothetical protein [Gilliamella sp.]
MVNIKEIQYFVNSSLYKTALDKLEQKYKITTNGKELPSVLFEYDANKINLSGANLSDLENILSNSLASFLKYIAIKFVVLLDEPDEQEGNDEEDVTISVGAPYEDFLIIHLLEYYLITSDAGNLINYLKKIKIPYSKKYCEQLKKIYALL